MTSLCDGTREGVPIPEAFGPRPPVSLGEGVTYSASMSWDPPRITGAAVTADALDVRFDGTDRPVRYPWRWVRDHSEDPSSLDPRTRQRSVDTFAIPTDLVAVAATVSDEGVRVEWADGAPAAELSAVLLGEVAGLVDPVPVRAWGPGSLPAPVPAVDHDAVLASDGGVREWLDAVDRLGFGLVRGMPTTREAVVALAGRVAYPRATIFGDVWRLSAELTEHDDSAYTRAFLEPHTDGSYSRDAPGLQLFACIERDGSGGESILVDGFDAAARLRRAAPEHFDLLTGIAVPGRYVEPGVDLRAARPTIGLDPRGDVCQVTFNNYDRAPFLLPVDEQEAWYGAYGHFHRLVNDRRGWLLVRLEPGDVLLFDNWRVLHGRMAYSGSRVFDGCYHNREDFESRLRVLRSTG